jgi:hypothetical protein
MARNNVVIEGKQKAKYWPKDENIIAESKKPVHC